MRGPAAKRSLPIVSHKSAIQREDSHMQKHESYNSITYQKSVILFGSVVVLSYTIKIYIFIFVHFTLCPSTMLELYQTESAAADFNFFFYFLSSVPKHRQNHPVPYHFLADFIIRPTKKEWWKRKNMRFHHSLYPSSQRMGPQRFSMAW